MQEEAKTLLQEFCRSETMHEFFFADRLIRSVLEYMEKAGLSSVSKVEIELGDLLGLSDESLRLAYSALSKGTRMEGSRIVIRRVEGEVVCKKCGHSGNLSGAAAEHSDPVFLCPDCGAPLSVKTGNECRILKVV